MAKPTVKNAANPRHQAAWEKFAIFAGIDEISYVDHGNGEDYILRKGNETTTLKVRGNRFDGGFIGNPQITQERDTMPP